MRRGATKDQPFIPGLAPERQRTAGRAKHKIFLAVKPDAIATEQAEDRTLRLIDEYGLAGTPLKPSNLHISLPLIFLGDEVPNGIEEFVSAVDRCASDVGAVASWIPSLVTGAPRESADDAAVVVVSLHATAAR